MDEPLDYQIILVAKPGRKQENLLALLDSIKTGLPVYSVKGCMQVHEYLQPGRYSLILVDYRYPTKELNWEIEHEFSNDENIQLVLLRLSHFEKINFSELKSIDLAFSDLTIESVRQLLNGKDQESV